MKQILLKTVMLMFALMCSAGMWATDVVYKTATFSSSSFSAGVQNYTSTFSSTTKGFKVDLSNFNNNNNGWDYVKTGNKSNASIGTITTNTAIDKAVTKVVVTIDAVTTSNVNSITLYSGTAANSCTTNEGTFTIATGAQAVTITSPAANKFYKISFDCKKGSSNGIVQVSKVEYYYDNNSDGGASDPVDASWSVSPASVSVIATKTATATITSNYDGTLSVSSNKTGVATATINGKVITVTGVAEGSATLTVTGAATSAYNAISKTIDVTVTANARPANEIFYESFDTNDGTGGNDGQWSGGIATGTIKQDAKGWVYVKGAGANQCAKFGTTSDLGSAKTPSISASGNFSLTFNAAAWNGKDESTTLKLSATGATLSVSSVTLKKGEWDTFNVNITNATEGFTIKFEGNKASSSRFFLDEVSIVQTAASISVDQYGYATFSSPYALDLDGMTEGFTAYQATSIKSETVTLTSVKGTVAANTGLVIKGEGECTIPVVASGSDISSTNLLVAVTEDNTSVPAGAYVLGVDGNAIKFLLIDGKTATLNAGKSYLAAAGGSANLRFVFVDSETGIAETMTSVQNGVAYNLNGQRVNANQKGIVIINGKKIYNK